MNRDEAFEELFGQWLEDGPQVAPVEPLAAGLAYIRAHPGQRAAGTWWRRVKSGATFTVPSQRQRGWLVAAATGILVVLAGYGLFNIRGQTGPGSVPTPTPTVTAEPSDQLTTTLAPGMATAAQTCATSTEGIATTVDQVLQSRGEVLDCIHTSADLRLAGTASVVFNWDEHPGGLWLGWGTIELRNEGGTWSGSYDVTSTSAASVMEFDSVWIGSGGYAGLEVLNHVRLYATNATIVSRVFEAGKVVTGTETCVTTTPGREFAGDDVTVIRGVALGCSDAMSDPRVSGQRQLVVSIDRRADESADLWGSSMLTNADGTWEGSFFGTVDAGYTDHHVVSLMRGTGEYEGLFFRLAVAGTGDPDFELSGEVVAGF